MLAIIVLFINICLLRIHAFVLQSPFRRFHSLLRVTEAVFVEPTPQVDYRVGFLFPDVGGDYGSMAERLYRESPGARRLYDKASEILRYDLLDKCVKQSKNSIESDLITQPAMFVTTMAAAEYFRETDPNAYNSCTVALGLSLGELSALCFADSISFEDGVKLAKARGQAIQFAAEQSNTGMALVKGKVVAGVEQLCLFAYQKSKEAIFVSMYLEDDTFVISGTTNALIAAAQVAIDYQASIDFLPRPVGLHSPFGSPASGVLFDALKTVNIRTPRVPVIFNADLSAETSPARIMMLTAGGLCQSVHWGYIVKQMVKDPQHRESYEIGPSTGLNKRIIEQQGTKFKVNSVPAV